MVCVKAKECGVHTMYSMDDDDNEEEEDWFFLREIIYKTYLMMGVANGEMLQVKGFVSLLRIKNLVEEEPHMPR